MNQILLRICVVLFTIAAQGRSQEDDEDGPYLGRYIGKLNTYHHQVSGDVYAVDDWTLLLVKFNYDGTGEDTFFRAGDSGRPGPQGFIVPDEHGKTNILERYHDAELRLALPEGKRISRMKWFAVYDIGSQNAFGDVYVPDDFEPPSPQTLSALAGTPAVSSQPVQILDAVTILIPELRYDGSGEEVYFWTGNGAQPSANGQIIPDEYGYLEPLRAYRGEDVRLRLPGELSAARVDWLALWDRGARRALASVLLPRALNVPPAPTRLLPYRSKLPSCKQLHRDYQVSWEVFGNQITIELVAQMGAEDYMSFGVSGSASRSAMLGADVAVASWDARQQRGLAADYNITDVAPCVQVLGAWRGVCRDARLGALDSNQVFSAERVDGLTRVVFRRTLKPEDNADLEWATTRPLYVVWAIGTLDDEGEPAFHRLYPRSDVALRLVPETPGAGDSDCVPFTDGAEPGAPAWEVAELFDPALRVFHFRLGPSGGRRGLAGRAGRRAAPALAWYVNGQLAPDIQLRRGLQYTFKVYGGNDPHSAAEYHPLVVTAAAAGGLERLGAAAQRAARVLAGVHYPRRGRLAPAAAGALCVARRAATADARRDDDYATFRAFNRSLLWECAGAPADLHVAPNSSWPDLVYYNSFTHAGMGGRIFVVDRHRRNIGRRNAAAAHAPAAALPALLAAAALQLAWLVRLLCGYRLSSLRTTVEAYCGENDDSVPDFPWDGYGALEIVVNADTRKKAGHSERRSGLLQVRAGDSRAEGVAQGRCGFKTRVGNGERRSGPSPVQSTERRFECDERRSHMTQIQGDERQTKDVTRGLRRYKEEIQGRWASLRVGADTRK
ncbi:cytochrome and DOMON domain-containing protein knickkopf [Aphomia sociella]